MAPETPSPSVPDERTQFAVLLFTDICDSTALKARHGAMEYRKAAELHNRLFESLAAEEKLTLIKNTGDGYFARSTSVAAVVRFALRFQHGMRAMAWPDFPITTRVGIHAGEVADITTLGQTDVLAPAADIVARVMGLAVGGQILLTRGPFDEARHFVRAHPGVGGSEPPAMAWLAHGPYLFKGCEDPLEVFEVGAEECAPLIAPPDGEKAKRAIRPGEEETLGWRPASGLEVPGRVGWLLAEKIGEGGFGEVWVGEHPKLHLRRAFKFCFDEERLRSLKREVTLVRLLRTVLGERDDIVHILELKLDEPPFYLESDFAPHGNLLQWAEKQGGLITIPLARRIGLVAHTATALAAAHSIGVLHKDIKPTNILIFDGPGGEPRPRLVDFGIGTLADPSVLVQHGVTGAGFTRATIQHSTGTPTYSPPEYLAGRPYTIQGDIYGLGVLLYQLVTAKSHDPLAPGWERDIADPLLREDIAVCVDGDPARRLASAADLAERLLHLEQRRAEAVERERLIREAAARAEAEAAALADRVRAVRLRKLTTAFAVLAVLAIVGGVFAWMNQRKADTALGEAGRRKAEVERKNIDYRAMLAEAARSDRLVADEKLKAGEQCEAFAFLARACEYDPQSTFAAEKAAVTLNVWRAPLPVNIFPSHEGESRSLRFSPDGWRIVTASADKTARVWDVATGKTIATLAGHTDTVWNAHFSLDGSRIVTASKDKTARVWDAATGKTIVTFAGHTEDVWSAQFSPDGSRIVTASSDKTARVWDAVTGKTLVTLAGHQQDVSSAHFSPNGSLILTITGSREAQIWNATTGESLAVRSGHPTSTGIGNGNRNRDAMFSPDGSRIVTGSWDKNAQVWDTATGKTIVTLTGHTDIVWSVQFSPDGSRIVTASNDKTARIWDAVTGKTIVTLAGYQWDVRSVQFSPDGSRIVTAGDGAARVWDASTGKILANLTGHADHVRDAQFSPDGSRIVTSGDESVRVWEAPPVKSPAILAGHQDDIESARFSPDETRIVTASSDKTARVWDTATGKTVAILKGHEDMLRDAQFSSDGARIVTASTDKTARVWDIATGKTIATLSGHTDSVWDAQFSPDGSRIVTASKDKTARVWDAATGKALVTLEGHQEEVLCAQFSPDGSRIVTPDGKTAQIWDAVTGKTLVTLTGHTEDVWSAQFSPDGSRIVTASSDKTARVWDASTGKSLLTLTGHEYGVSGAQFSLDAARIITTSGEDAETRVWDSTSGKSLVTLHEGELGRPAQINPDSSRILTANGVGYLWDTVSGKRIATLEGHVSQAWFSPSGSRIVNTFGDGPDINDARVWTILPHTAGPHPGWFPDFLRYMAQMRLNSDGELEALNSDDWLKLHEQMREVRRAGAGQDTPYVRILRHFVSE